MFYFSCCIVVLYEICLAIVFFRGVCMFSIIKNIKNDVVECRVVFSACGTRSGIVEFRVIYFSAHVESALILCNFMSYIFFCAIVGTTRSDIVKVRVTHFSSRVREKRSLILCNFGLYIFFRLCGTRSRIVESRVIYFFLDRVE